MHSVERIYLRQQCFDTSNPRVAALTGAQCHYVIKLRVTLWEKTIRFRHPDYDPDRAQKLISSFMSRHLSTRNISSKSMHTFLSNLAHRQTDRQTNTGVRAKTYTSSVVEGKLPYLISNLYRRMLCIARTVQCALLSQDVYQQTFSSSSSHTILVFAHQTSW